MIGQLGEISENLWKNCKCSCYVGCFISIKTSVLLSPVVLYNSHDAHSNSSFTKEVTTQCQSQSILILQDIFRYYSDILLN